MRLASGSTSAQEPAELAAVHVHLREANRLSTRGAHLSVTTHLRVRLDAGIVRTVRAMSTYVIVDVGLRDEADRAAFQQYAERTDALLVEAGAAVIAYDPAPRVLEGDWTPRTVVVQRYPDAETVDRFRRSDVYAPLKALRQRIADTNVIVVNGMRADGH